MNTILKHASDFKTLMADSQVKQVSGKFEGLFTPKLMMDLRSQLRDQNLPVTDMLIGTGVWNNLVSDAEFIKAVDPVAKHELLLCGLLATIYGMNVWSDAYFHPEERFVDRNAVHMFSL